MDALLDFWTFFLFGLAQQKLVRKLRLDLFGCLLRQEVREAMGLISFGCGATRCCDEDGVVVFVSGGGVVVVVVAVVVVVMIRGVVVVVVVGVVVAAVVVVVVVVGVGVVVVVGDGGRRWWRGAGCVLRRLEQRRADEPANSGHAGDVRGPHMGVSLHDRGHGALSCLHTVITTIVVLRVVTSDRNEQV